MIPNPTKKRLIQLSRLLTQVKASVISSVDIEALSGWKDTTVRKDISYVLKEHPVKSASNGYAKEELLEAIRVTLQENSEKKRCCIVGLGKIAQALIQSKDIDESEFLLIAGFDESINRVETMNAPFSLFALSKLESTISELDIDYAILDVDDNNASEVATRLTACAIKGIVNYTNAILPVGEKTKVENVSVIAALQNLAY